MSEILTMKPKVSTSVMEQETVINMSADVKTAFVYTAMQRDLRRMWKLYAEHPDEVKVLKDDKYGTEFEIPAEWVRIKPKRAVSEEQRLAAAERFAAFRNKSDEPQSESDDEEE